MGQKFEFYFFLEPDIFFSVQWKRTKKTNTQKEKEQQMMRER